MLLIFMGQMAMGKSFAAKAFSKDSGIAFLEGDSVIPGKYKVLLTDADVDQFVKESLTKEIAKQLALHNGNLIVSYAFYREAHRKFILDAFKDCTDVVFIHIVTSLDIQKINLAKRKCRYFWQAFASASRIIAFESPQLPHETLFHDNLGYEDLLIKLKKMPFYKKLLLLPNLLPEENKDIFASIFAGTKKITQTDKQSFYKRHPFFIAGVIACGLAAAYEAAASSGTLDQLKKNLFL